MSEQDFPHNCTDAYLIRIIANMQEDNPRLTPDDRIIVLYRLKEIETKLEGSDNERV